MCVFIKKRTCFFLVYYLLLSLLVYQSKGKGTKGATSRTKGATPKAEKRQKVRNLCKSDKRCDKKRHIDTFVLFCYNLKGDSNAERKKRNIRKAVQLGLQSK